MHDRLQCFLLTRRQSMPLRHTSEKWIFLKTVTVVVTDSPAVYPSIQTGKHIAECKGRNVPSSLETKQQHCTPPPVAPFKPHQQQQRPEGPSRQATRNRRPAPPPPCNHWPVGQVNQLPTQKKRNGLCSPFHTTYLFSAAVLHASLSTNRSLRLGGSAGFLSDGT